MEVLGMDWDSVKPTLGVWGVRLRVSSFHSFLLSQHMIAIRALEFHRGTWLRASAAIWICHKSIGSCEGNKCWLSSVLD